MQILTSSEIKISSSHLTSGHRLFAGYPNRSMIDLASGLYQLMKLVMVKLLPGLEKTRETKPDPTLSNPFYLRLSKSKQLNPKPSNQSYRTSEKKTERDTMDHIAAAEEQIVSERLRRKLDEVNVAAQSQLSPIQDHINFTLQVYKSCL